MDFGLLFRKNEAVSAGDVNCFRTAPISYSYTFTKVFFTINPLDHNYDHERQIPGGRRADLNVTAFRSFLFEMDKIDLETQYKVLERLKEKFPPTMATFSGSKSIHFLYTLAEDLPLTPHKLESINEYKRFWRRFLLQISSHISDLVPNAANAFDPACKNPSRLTRTPGVIRPDTGKEQTLLYQGLLVSPSRVEQLPQDELYTTFFPSEFKGWRDWTLAEFEAYAETRPWHLFFHYPVFWAASSGNYDKMFRHILWAIDDSGASFDILDAYLSKHTYPMLLSKGYPRDKVRKPITDAYLKKGRKA